MFSKSAQYYDEIYASVDKDYASEAAQAHAFIKKYKQTKGKSLLDVACGTGTHAGYLSKYYQVEGLDLDAKLLAVAKKKHPNIRFHQGDMLDFDLGRQFDVVVCLFSSIAYVKTKSRLGKAIKTMARHVLPGGVLVVEPWFSPRQWHPGRASMVQINKPDLKIVRMSYSRQRGKLSLIDFQYLIGTPKGIEHSVEIHELGLFTHQEYLGAFKAAGLNVIHDPEGLDGRGCISEKRCRDDASSLPHEMNTSTQTKPFWKRLISPALALWLIAPIFGEMVSGSTPLNEYTPMAIVLFGMLYGSGALLIREMLVRWGKSWRGLLLLGMAYGIYEEGLMVRSFFDPGWQDLGKLGVYGRAAGVNWVWTEHLIIFHMLVSVAASIVFVEILYPDRRAASWIGPRGWKWNIFALAATLPIGALGVDQYNTPDAWLGVCWLVIALLALAAWRAGHAPAVKEMRVVKVPHPRLFWWTGFLGMLGQLIIIYRTADQNGPPFPVTMLLIALFDLFILWLILRWSGQAQSWDDRHRLALLSGALSLFLILTPLVTNGQYPIMYFSNPILLILLGWVSHKVNQRVKSEQVGTTPAASLAS